LSQDGFDHVKVLDIGVAGQRTGPFRSSNISSFDFGVSNVDLAVTFRNMHNFTADGRRNMNAAVFKSLRSGGLFGIVDHTKRHMELMTNENRRYRSSTKCSPPGSNSSILRISTIGRMTNCVMKWAEKP
jgi:hypothetical protein